MKSLGRTHQTIEDVVKDYAGSQNIYTNNNEFAHKLHMLARYFEGYDYDDLYDRWPIIRLAYDKVSV